MQILGQQKHALWDVDNIEIFPGAYENNPLRMCGKKPETFIGSWVHPRGLAEKMFVVLGIYSHERCLEVMADLVAFYKDGGHVYEMPKE